MNSIFVDPFTGGSEKGKSFHLTVRKHPKVLVYKINVVELSSVTPVLFGEVRVSLLAVGNANSSKANDIDM